MTNETNDSTISRVDFNRVYIEQDGSLYFIKTTKTYKFLLINQDGRSIYGTTPIKTEQSHVTPESLGYTKKATWDILVYKTVEGEGLEKETIFYSMTLNFEVPNEARYRTAFFKKTRSGRVFLKWFDSSCCSEVSINDEEFCKRGKAKRLPEDTIIQRNAPIFTLSSSGELERRIEANDSAYGF